jgi:hypothetical protein
MFREEAFRRAGGYRQNSDYWEDLDLFLRMARVGRILTIARPLYYHRFSDTSTRLTSARIKVENAVDLMFRCREAYGREGDYESLLAEPRYNDPSVKLNPNVFPALGFITLWAGCRPRVLGRLLNRGKLRSDFVTLRALVWSLWAEVSPRSLRAVMRLFLGMRNAVAKRRLRGKEVVEWVRHLPDPAQEVRLLGSATL